MASDTIVDAQNYAIGGKHDHTLAYTDINTRSEYWCAKLN